MKYAPIYIPTLCRDAHFIRGLESLKKNGWAKYTDVYIALDYPAKESHWEGYRKICGYLENGDFSVFAGFFVYKREKNIGSLANIDSMRDELMEKYDRWIMAEDDIEFSPVFLEYMNKCLDLFENDPEVFAVNGYTYPVSFKISEGSNAVKQFATVSEWGIGYWKDKYLIARDRIHDRAVFCDEDVPCPHSRNRSCSAQRPVHAGHCSHFSRRDGSRDGDRL